MGSSAKLLDKAGVCADVRAGGNDPGLFEASAEDTAKVAQRFIKAVAMHRHPARKTDPPRI